jgi:hypothetical protein
MAVSDDTFSFLFPLFDLTDVVMSYSRRNSMSGRAAILPCGHWRISPVTTGLRKVEL